MSQDISVPGARVPMVDANGVITREWLMWILGMFERVGGRAGFSNSELYGDAVALQSYDELLERISSLEAQNRDLSRAVQMVAMGQWETTLATAPPAISPDTFARIKVLGDSDLATDTGRVRIGAGVSGSTAKFQVAGAIDATGEVKGASMKTGAFEATGNVKASTFSVGANQVVGARVAGVPAYASYAGQTIGATYTQAQVQTTDNAIKAASAKLSALVAALRTHGLIGD